MEKKELTITKLKPDLYLLNEAEVTAYLVIGDKKACLIDTMFGYNNSKEVIEKITDKPLIVVNTHGHPDHIYGNVYYDHVYMNYKDLDISKEFVNDPFFANECKKQDFSMPPFKDIKEGDIIDLGNKTLEVYEISEHTPGGILLLLKEDRILFTGDSINHHLWLQLPHSLSLEECVKSLDRLMFLEKKADLILHGHAKDYDDISLMHCLRNGIQEIIDGKTKKDEPYNWKNSNTRQHSFKVDKDKHYQQDDHKIIYNA